MKKRSGKLRRIIEERAKGRCEYCHASQPLCGYRFHLDHIHPPSQGGSNLVQNRALACAACNLTKQEKVMGRDPITRREVPLFHPRLDQWSDHSKWQREKATILGLTPTGRATIEVLFDRAQFGCGIPFQWCQTHATPLEWYPTAAAESRTLILDMNK